MPIVDRAKISLVGLAGAGKTSIFNRFFLHSTIKDVESVKPTNYFTVNQPILNFINKNIWVYDLGGQKRFRKDHLNQIFFFKDARIVLFVVDVAKPDLIPEIEEYFLRIITKVRHLNPDKSPLFLTLLHKYDPGRRDELSRNIPLFISTITKLLKQEKVTFHTTSIYDDSIYRAMVTALIQSLPTIVIKQSLNAELLNYALLTITDLYERQKVIDPILDLFSFAIPFGRELGKRLLNEWLSFALALVDKEDVDEKEESFLLQLTAEGAFEFRIKTPFKGLKPDSRFLITTHGLVTGTAEFLGFSKVDLLESRIQDSFEHSIFKIH